MAAKNKKTEDASWDRIGELIGASFEKDLSPPDPKVNYWSWCHTSKGGGFGRFLFIIGVLLALSTLGKLDGISTWILLLIVIGFTMMKF